jgi:hypothetical protein
MMQTSDACLKLTYVSVSVPIQINLKLSLGLITTYQHILVI